jgi:hypothetical protein
MSILVELPERLYQRDAFASFAAVAPYSLGTARAMAWMSQLAYETAHRDKIETICRLWDLRLLQIIANDNGGSICCKIHTRRCDVKGTARSSLHLQAPIRLFQPTGFRFRCRLNVGSRSRPG